MRFFKFEKTEKIKINGRAPFILSMFSNESVVLKWTKSYYFLSRWSLTVNLTDNEAAVKFRSHEAKLSFQAEQVLAINLTTKMKKLFA